MIKSAPAFWRFSQPGRPPAFPAPVRRLDSLGVQDGGEVGKGRWLLHASALMISIRIGMDQTAHHVLAG